MKRNRRRHTQRNTQFSTLGELALSTLVAFIAGGAFYFACILGDKL